MSSKNFNFNYPPITGQKRPRVDSGNNSNINSPAVQVYDRFYKISMVNGSFKTTSPFLLHKALQSTFGTLADTKKQADGSILIEVSNERQSDIAKSLTKLHEFEVNTVAHKTLNTVKGVISCPDLQHCTDEEILENLCDQGVSEIYRIINRKDNTKPSFTFIVSFKLHSLPAKIHAGWYSIRVRPYIPSPMRCFNCQQFGHTAARCSQEATCPSCGHKSHSDVPCTLTPKCINCGESHSPRYKGCSKFKIEFDIQKLKTTEKISYFEAKRKYHSLHPTFPLSFSAVAKGTNKMVNSATQCDLISAIPSPFTRPSQSQSTSSENPPTHLQQKSSPPPPPTHPHTSLSKHSSHTTKPQDQKTSTGSKTTSSKPSSRSTNPSTISKVPTKKKSDRSGKSTPSSSSESILDIQTPDINMELESGSSGKINTRKK